jgi:hypothetical protein
MTGLLALRCGDNSNVVGNLFSDGGPTGAGGFVDTSVGPGPTTTGATAGSGTGGSGGSGGSSGSGGSGGSGGSSTGNPFPCTEPMEVTSPPSGYVRCANGMVHRPEKRQCPESLPRSRVLTDAGSAPCRRDADCQAKPHGHCEYWNGLAGSGYACEYGCVNDAECAAGEICLCGDPTGTCVAAGGCTTDADCGGTLLCVGFTEGCMTTRFACQSFDDTCGSEFDCAGKAVCVGSGCVCTKQGTKASCTPRCVAAP